MKELIVACLISSACALLTCRFSIAESVGFNRKAYRKHPELKPKNVIEFVSGRNYLRWKKSSFLTRSWYRINVWLLIMTLCELSFFLTQMLIVRADETEFFNRLAGGKSGILVIGLLPILVGMSVHWASRKGLGDSLRRVLVEAICPVFAALVSIVFLALIPLLAVWSNS